LLIINKLQQKRTFKKHSKSIQTTFKHIQNRVFFDSIF
jgi:hypothetical protein